MKNKWIFRLSLSLNILFISVILIVGWKYLVINHNYGQSNQTNSKTTPDFQWPEDKKMALSLTFDDAALSQIDSGIPILDRYGVKATFYVSIWKLQMRLGDWKKAISNGHEIGNHSLSHPCSENYDFVKKTALEDYTISRMRTDLSSENEVIKKLLGFQPVSFAYPCGQTFIGRGINTKSYVPLVADMFESGRLYGEGMINPALCDMSQLSSEHLDGRSFNQIKELIETGKSTGKWLILTGHIIAEGVNKTTQKSTIEALCKYAMDPSNGIWIDNIHNVASYIREKRGDGPFVQMPGYKNPLNSAFSKLWSEYYLFKMKLLRKMKPSLFPKVAAKDTQSW